MTLKSFIKTTQDPMKNHMGGCQNYGPFLGTLNNRCRIILRTQEGTLILTTTHISFRGPYSILNSRILIIKDP